MNEPKMKYISLAFHNNEMVIVDDMRVFTTHFCYSKKQRQGPVDIIAPVAVSSDEPEKAIVPLEIVEAEMADEDDI